MRARLLVDVDQVLADFLTPMLNLVNAIWDKSFKLDDMKSWNLYDSFEVPGPIRRQVDAVIDSPGFARTLKVLPGSQEGVQALMEIGDVYVVTSPWESATWIDDRKAWLKYHFGIVGNRVLPIHDKHVVAGDCLIDDKTSTLKQWAKAHPNGLPVQWGHPSIKYNASPFIQPTCWDDAVEDIKEHVYAQASSGKQRIWHHE